MARKSKRTSLFLFEDQLEALARLSEQTGAPQSEMIRRAIDAYLQHRSVENGKGVEPDRPEVRPSGGH